MSAEALVEFRTPAGEWVDITCDVRAIDISSGREDTLEPFRAATATIVMANFAGVYSAWVDDTIWQTGTPYRTNVPIRVSMVRAGVAHRLFTGTTDAVTDSWPGAGRDARVVVLATDGFKLLNRYDHLGQEPVEWVDDFEVKVAGQLPPYDCTWNDDFDRADGDLGADWSQPVSPTTTYTIDTGAVVMTPKLASTVDASDRVWRTTPTEEPDQFIEIEIADLVTPVNEDGYVELYTQMAADGLTAQVVMISPTPATGRLDWTVTQWEGTWADYSVWDDGAVAGIDWDPCPTFTFRLDSYGDGRQVFSIDGEIITDWVSPNFVVGPYIGFAMLSGTSTTGSPRVLSVTGGCS